MAFDGTTVAALADEFNRHFSGGHISKIAQPEKDEIILTIKNNIPSENENGKFRRVTEKVLISADPSLPLCYITDENKLSPVTAPTFCMVLRKYLSGSLIKSVTQPGLERVICFTCEHMNEMGDMCSLKLYAELMGKHSNIILTDENDTITDSIKHISVMTSSVREVLPGRKYFIPNTMDKTDPFTDSSKESVINYDTFEEKVLKKPQDCCKAIYTNITGISPLIANELLFRAGLSLKNSTAELDAYERFKIYNEFEKLMKSTGRGDFDSEIILKNSVPDNFAVTPLTMYKNNGNEYISKKYNSVSEMINSFYSERQAFARIREKSSNLRHIVSTSLERSRKKLAAQEKQFKSTEKRDRYRHFGELINTYGYGLKGGEKELVCTDYETNKEVHIPLDQTKSISWNAKHYFERYDKLKRTYEALTIQIKETKEEIEHLESVQSALDFTESQEDLDQIRNELVNTGYIHSNKAGKKGRSRSEKSRPLHFISSEGYDIFIGKNNYQNDELTFKKASGNDWWFHAKHAAGSHVILVSKDRDHEPSDKAFEEAAAAAAWFSKLRNNPKAEVDYVMKKEVKKPKASKPGFVVYYTNFSMTISPGINGLTPVSD